MMPQQAASSPANGRQVQKPSPKLLRQQRIGIGADRVECDVAEVEQAGQPDHDRQPPAQHDIGQNQDAEVDPVTAGVERHGEREDQQERSDEVPGAGAGGDQAAR